MTAKGARHLAAQPLWTWAERPRSWVIVTSGRFYDTLLVVIDHNVYWPDVWPDIASRAKRG